jgi:hypothetical protein
MHKGDANSIFRTFLMAMPGSYSFEPDTEKEQLDKPQSFVEFFLIRSRSEVKL